MLKVEPPGDDFPATLPAYAFSVVVDPLILNSMISPSFHVVSDHPVTVPEDFVTVVIDGGAMTARATQYRAVAPASFEQRAEERHRVCLTRATVRRTGNVAINAQLYDISIYGCRVSCEEPHHPGERVWVRLAGDRTRFAAAASLFEQVERLWTAGLVEQAEPLRTAGLAADD